MWTIRSRGNASLTHLAPDARIGNSWDGDRPLKENETRWGDLLNPIELGRAIGEGNVTNLVPEEISL